ncbi:prepilin-type N-terminal cleavage/methylation domain-containing protein [Thermodesulfobacteriota bacterium]
MIIRNEKGFSLAETMLAILILGIGMLGVGSLLITSLKSDGKTRHTRNAQMVALEHLESLKAEIADLDMTGKYSETGYIPGSDNPKYYCSWVYTKVARDPLITSPAEIKDLATDDLDSIRLDVYVGWPVGKGSCVNPDKPYKCLHRLTMTSFVIPK